MEEGKDHERCNTEKDENGSSKREGLVGCDIKAPVDWFKMLSRKTHWTAVVAVVVVYGLNQGLGGALARVGTEYYMKDVQKVQPSESQAYLGITRIPWIIKPIWGLLTDVVPVFGYRRRPYFVLAEMDLFTVVHLAKPVEAVTGTRLLREGEEPVLASTAGRTMELDLGETGTSSSVAIEATPVQRVPSPRAPSPIVQPPPVVADPLDEEMEGQETGLLRKRSRSEDGASSARKKRPVTVHVESSASEAASSHPSADVSGPQFEQGAESPPKESPVFSESSEPEIGSAVPVAAGDASMGQLVDNLVSLAAQLKAKCVGENSQDNQKDQRIASLEAQLASAKAEIKEANVYAERLAGEKMSLLSQIDQERAEAVKYKLSCNWALKHLEQGKENLFAQLGELGATVSWSLEVQEAKLRKLSIEYDEELYPQLMSTIAERRWLIGHGLRLAALSTLESPEVVNAFGEVMQCALERGKSEAIEKLHEAKLLKAPIDKVPNYDAESYDHLVAAMQRMKDLELPMISELERDQDYPIDVIMAGLTLARHLTEGAEAQPDYYLKPHESQLQVPVFARPRDSLNPFALEKEVPLKEVLEAHATRLAKKEGIEGKAILCGVGAAHLPRSDGVPVSVATVSRHDADLFKGINEAKDATGHVGTSSLKRCSSW